MEARSGEEENTLLASALACAEAGYPVFPCWPQSKIRRTSPASGESTDVRQVRQWWERMPDSNVGVWLNDIPMVVLDIDGPKGEESLARLVRQSGLESLPATVEVLTGREGGRHLWFRLPDGAVKLVSQHGRVGGRSPGLDVLFRGNAVGPGSIHKSGRVYTAVGGVIPALEDLTELPRPLYDLLKARGKVYKPREAPNGPVERRTAGTPTPSVPSGVVVPQETQALLDDRSDGRDQRTLMAVTQLVECGLTDEEISEVVLSSPLGSKANEQPDPQRWLARKIEAARQYQGPEWDRQSYWWAVHTSGMTPAEVKVLDYLWCKASKATGVVSASERQVGLGAGVANPHRVLRRLLEGLWLVEVRPGSRSTATRYRLVGPGPRESASSRGALGPSSTPQGGLGDPRDTPSKEGSTQGVPGGTPNPNPNPNPTTCWGLSTTFSVDLIGHDAFRSRQGSLASAYPLLTLLSLVPQPIEKLGAWLGKSARSLRGHIAGLTDAGVAVATDEGLALATVDLVPLLDAVASRAGTTGKRAAQEHANAEADHEWRERKRRADEVGTPEWKSKRKKKKRETVEWQIQHGNLPPDTDVDEIAEYMVAWELDALQGDLEHSNDAHLRAAGDGPLPAKPVRFRRPSRTLLTRAKSMPP